MSGSAMSGRIVAFVPDLMDRSRLSAHDVDVVRDIAELAERAVDARLVVVDLARPAVVEVAVELVAAGVRVVGFAPHVDDDLRSAAAAGGVEVLARSRFFGNVERALGGT
jgi:tRNA A58 N-methylase Trm61